MEPVEIQMLTEHDAHEPAGYGSGTKSSNGLSLCANRTDQLDHTVVSTKDNLRLRDQPPGSFQLARMYCKDSPSLCLAGLLPWYTEVPISALMTLMMTAEVCCQKPGSKTFLSVFL